jgi:hypothetical protein
MNALYDVIFVVCVYARVLVCMMCRYDMCVCTSASVSALVCVNVCVRARMHVCMFWHYVCVCVSTFMCEMMICDMYDMYDITYGKICVNDEPDMHVRVIWYA